MYLMFPCDRFTLKQCNNLKTQYTDILDPIVSAGCMGGDSCCTEENKCGEQEGDCDSDSQCLDGLKCGDNNCTNKTGMKWDSGDDCCYKP